MDKIIKALNSPDESERLYAVQDIIALKDSPNINKTDGFANPADAYAEVLIKHLASETETSKAVKESIVYALKLMHFTNAFPLLFELFQNAEAYLRNAAVSIFGTRGVDGVAFLTSQLDHSDREVRKLVIDSLFQIGSKEAVLAIRAGLNDPSINVRITAVEYLGQLGDTQSIEDILDMLEKENDPMLITAALETILQIGNDTNIEETIKFLTHNNLDSKIDILKVHPVFIPEFIKLIAKSGTVENLLNIIDFLKEKETYTKDIILAIQNVKNRSRNLLCENKIFNFIIDAIENKVLAETVRYASSELLLTDILDNPDGNDAECINKIIFFEIGKHLVKEPSMTSAGIRFLAKSETKESKDIINSIKVKSKDINLLALYDELNL